MKEHLPKDQRDEPKECPCPDRQHHLFGEPLCLLKHGPPHYGLMPGFVCRWRKIYPEVQS